jgi:hypothetical protein
MGKNLSADRGEDREEVVMGEPGLLEMAIFNERVEMLRKEAGRVLGDVALMVSGNNGWGDAKILQRELYAQVVAFTGEQLFRAAFMEAIVGELKQRLEFAEQARAVGDENTRLRAERETVRGEIATLSNGHNQLLSEVNDLKALTNELRQGVDWHQENIEEMRGAIVKINPVGNKKAK